MLVVVAWQPVNPISSFIFTSRVAISESKPRVRPSQHITIEFCLNTLFTMDLETVDSITLMSCIGILDEFGLGTSSGVSAKSLEAD